MRSSKRWLLQVLIAWLALAPAVSAAPDEPLEGSELEKAASTAAPGEAGPGGDAIPLRGRAPLPQLRSAGDDPSWVRVVGWTFLVAALGISLAIVARRRRHGSALGSGTPHVRLIESVRLGDRRFVHVLALQDRVLIVGASSAGISLLTEAEPDSATRPLEPWPAAPGQSPGAGSMAAATSPTAWSSSRSSSREEDPVSHRPFADALRGARKRLGVLSVLVLLGLCAAGPARAQQAPFGPGARIAAELGAALGTDGGSSPAKESRLDAQVGPVEVSLAVGEGDGSDDYGAAIKIALIVTLLSLAPAILMTMTAFTRVVIVFGFLRTALGTPNLPPNQVIVGLALFMTCFLMGPTATGVYDDAVAPHMRGEVTFQEAAGLARSHVLSFMLRATREQDLALFLNVANVAPATVEEVPLRAAVPAFVISELKTAFQMGFVLFLPFMVVDLVVSAVLLSMGMMMLSPITISIPIKVLLFVLIDGWQLLTRALLAGTALT